MRYVERYRFNDAASMNTPVPLIYQKLRTDYKKSNDEKSTEIWNNFTIGIRQLEGVKLKVAAGEKFTLSDLQAVHKGFFTVSDEKGDFTHEPHPGEIKPESDQDNEWWKLKSEDVASAVAVVDRKNSEYQQMGLMTNFKGDAYINNLLSMKPLGAGFAIYSGDTRANKQHTENILNFMNTLLEQAHQGQHMVWRGELFSPARLAFFVQQYYVAIHPFHEGNGRTSRFLQELILTSFSLPHGSSGDLMASDVLTGHEDYYRLAVNKTSELVQALQNCMDGPYKFVTGPIGASKDLASKDQSTIEYGCRIIGN